MADVSAPQKDASVFQKIKQRQQQDEVPVSSKARCAEFINEIRWGILCLVHRSFQPSHFLSMYSTSA